MRTSQLLSLMLLMLFSDFGCSFASSPGSGCGNPLPADVQPGTSINLTLSSESGITPRKYRLHLPESYNISKQVPLILSFHGRGKDAKFQEELSQFSDPSFGFEGIAVYPEGVPNVNGTQQFQGDPDAPDSINDVKFTLELLDHLQYTFCINTNRIYAAGKSNGGGFTGLLACDSDATKRIAAFAPVSGAFYLNANGSPPTCNPSRKPIPIMEFHGFNDSTILYAGGPNTRGNAQTPSIIAYVDDWVRRDGFEVADSNITHLCNGKKTVTRYSWNDMVVHYNYTNLDHDWPSKKPNGDTQTKLTCEEAEATSIILEWFKMWTL